MAADLDDMALFATVARAGSFTAAARALGITKQSVSERVGKLEQRLGVSLLARSTRSMRLTEPGERFLRACESVVALAEEATREIAKGREEPKGLLRVTAPEVLGHELVLPVVAELRARHAGLRFALALTDERLDPIEAGLDVALRLGEVPKGASARLLGHAKQLFVASPELIARHREPRTLAQLEGLPCVGRAAAERWTLAGRTRRIEPAVVVSTHEGLLRAARLGLGVTRIAEALAADDLRKGRLVALFDARPALAGPVHALHREPLSRRVELFLEVLERHARRFAPLGAANRSMTKSGARS